MYCGICPVYRAFHEGDENKTFDISFRTRCTIDMIKCEGCGTSDRFALSKGCTFRKCAKGRGLESCGLCKEFPCDTLLGLYDDDMRLKGEAEKNARRIREHDQFYTKGRDDSPDLPHVPGVDKTGQDIYLLFFGIPV